MSAFRTPVVRPDNGRENSYYDNAAAAVAAAAKPAAGCVTSRENGAACLGNDHG